MPVFVLYLKESLCCYVVIFFVIELPIYILCTFSNGIDLVNPVKSRAALFWIFCSVN